MKYVINSDRLVRFVEKFLNKLDKHEWICDIQVGYNEEYNRIVLNFYFKKDILEDKSGELRTKLEDIRLDIADKMTDYLNISPWTYVDAGDC